MVSHSYKMFIFKILIYYDLIYDYDYKNILIFYLVIISLDSVKS